MPSSASKKRRDVSGNRFLTDFFSKGSSSNRRLTEQSSSKLTQQQSSRPAERQVALAAVPTMPAATFSLPPTLTPLHKQGEGTYKDRGTVGSIFDAPDQLPSGIASTTVPIASAATSSLPSIFTTSRKQGKRKSKDRGTVNAGSISDTPDQLGGYKLLQPQHKIVRGPEFFYPQGPVLPGYNGVYKMTVARPGDLEPTESELIKSKKKSGGSTVAEPKIGLAKAKYKEYSSYHDETGKEMWLIAVKAYELVKKCGTPLYFRYHSDNGKVTTICWGNYEALLHHDSFLENINIVQQ